MLLDVAWLNSLFKLSCHAIYIMRRKDLHAYHLFYAY